MNCESCGGPLIGEFISAEPYTVRSREHNRSAHVIYAKIHQECSSCGAKWSIMEDISSFLNNIFPVGFGDLDA